MPPPSHDAGSFPPPPPPADEVQESILPARDDPWRQNVPGAGWVWGGEADVEPDVFSAQAVAASSLAARRARQRRRKQMIKGARYGVLLIVLTPLVAWGVYELRVKADTSGYVKHFDNAQVTTFVGSTPTSGSSLRPEAWYPPIPLDESAVPLGRPPTTATVRADMYSFLTREPDGKTPVTYDPCRPVHFALRRAGEPAFGEKLVLDAIAEVSAATGLRWIRDPDTTEPTNFSREPVQIARYGNRWAPVLITWSSPAEEPELSGDVIGLGGSHPERNSFGTGTFVTGSLALDANDMLLVAKRPNGLALDKAIVLHELGHVVGLGHVGSASQIMFPQANPAITDYQDGDRAGLAILGNGPCNPGV